MHQIEGERVQLALARKANALTSRLSKRLHGQSGKLTGVSKVPKQRRPLQPNVLRPPSSVESNPCTVTYGFGFCPRSLSCPSHSMSNPVE
jgi:hypothetical protein